MVILMALSIGMAPIIGQNWGAGNLERVRQTIRHALIFAFIWSTLGGLTLLLLREPIAGIFSEDPHVTQTIALYFLIVGPSYALGNIIHGWSSAFNAIGKPQIAASALLTKTILLGIPAVIIGNNMGGTQGVFIALSLINVGAGLAFHFWAHHALGSRYTPALQA